MKFFNYIKESIHETGKIKWSTRNETVYYSVAVLVISLVVAYYLGFLDVLFAKALNLIIK
jgi:preprotein translocase SecE subunit